MVNAARYDASTALIVVDLQNDFADPKGSLYVREGEAVVPVANAQIAAALEVGALVVYTQDWHPQSTPHFEKDGGLWPVHCVQDSWGAAFHPDLRVEGDIVRKGSRGEDGYSGDGGQWCATKTRQPHGCSFTWGRGSPEVPGGSRGMHEA